MYCLFGRWGFQKTKMEVCMTPLADLELPIFAYELLGDTKKHWLNFSFFPRKCHSVEKDVKKSHFSKMSETSVATDASKVSEFSNV